MNKSENLIEAFKSGSLSVPQLTQKLWGELRGDPASAQAWLTQFQALQEQGSLSPAEFEELKNMTQTFLHQQSAKAVMQAGAEEKKMSAIQKQKAFYKTALTAGESPQTQQDVQKKPSARPQKRVNRARNTRSTAQAQPTQVQSRSRLTGEKQKKQAEGETCVQTINKSEKPPKSPIRRAHDGVIIPSMSHSGVSIQGLSASRTAGDAVKVQSKKESRLNTPTEISAIPPDLVTMPLTLHATDRSTPSDQVEQSHHSDQVDKGDTQSEQTASHQVESTQEGSSVENILPKAPVPPKKSWLRLFKPALLLAVVISAGVSVKVLMDSSSTNGSDQTYSSLIQTVSEKIQSLWPKKTAVADSQQPSKVKNVEEVSHSDTDDGIADKVAGKASDPTLADTRPPIHARSSKEFLDDIRQAVDDQRIEPIREQGTALFVLKQMSETYPDAVHLQEARAVIAEAYLDQAKLARQKEAWSEAVVLVSKALSIRRTNPQ